MIQKTAMVLFLSLLTNQLQAQKDSVQSVSELLELSIEELLDLSVVTASGTEQKISEAPSTMLVITSAQIAERGYLQLDDVLRDIPGVDLIHIYGQTTSFITFRGMYGDENRRVLFMIDGVIENSIMGGFEIAGPAYSLLNVDRIEIIWGPGSALYGANAFSAVINVITKKGDEIHGLKYQKGFGSFNTGIDNILMGIRKSNIDLVISGSLHNTDGPQFYNRDPHYSNSYVNNAFSLNGNISYILENFKSTLGVRVYQTPSGQGELASSPTILLGIPSQGNQNTGQSGIIQRDFNGESPSLADIYARTVFLQNEYTPNSKLTVILKGQYRETGRSEKSYAYVNNPGTNYVSRNPIVYYANRFGGDLSARYNITDQQLITVGCQFYQDNLERGFRGVIPDKTFDTISNIPVTNLRSTFKPREFSIQNNIGTYLQYVVNTAFLKKTNFTLGARYDINSVYGSSFNPRLGIINQPLKRLTFKILYGTAFRAPTNFELTEAAGSRLANPNLKPEKVSSYELNISYTPVKIMLIQSNLFQNELTDAIVLVSGVSGKLNQNQNVGSATVKGIETKLDFFPSKKFSAFLNFTYQEGTQNDGIRVFKMSNIANVKGNVGFSLNVGQLFTVNVIENCVGARSVTATNPLDKVNGYFTTNLVISTKYIFENRVSASISIRNLFNQKYYDPGIRTANGNLYSTVIDQPGINGMFKISISL